MTNSSYDVVIIGCGPAGMTAALYTSRANLKTLVLEQGVPGGEVLNTAEVENYPGFASITGPELAEAMYEGAMRFGAEYAYGCVKEIIPQETDAMHKVVTDNESYLAKAVIIATGSTHKHLGVAGEEEYAGRGVSYCAVCDGAFFKDREILVVGGGDSAVEEGTYLTQYAKKVEIVHWLDHLQAQQILQERALSNDKISVLWQSQVKEILGDGQKVTAVLLQGPDGEVKEKTTEGVFVYIGLKPNSEAFANLHICDDYGWIETDELMQTKIPGIFACGDVRSKRLRQISTAVGDGGTAGQFAYQYIQEHFA